MKSDYANKFMWHLCNIIILSVRLIAELVLALLFTLYFQLLKYHLFLLLNECIKAPWAGYLTITHLNNLLQPLN